MPGRLIYPPGRKPGLLLRKSRPGQWCPLAAERVKIIPEREWDDAAQEVDLTTKIRDILDQGSVGSCACESGGGADMIVRAVMGLPHVLLNPYAAYHFLSGGHDSGSSIDDVLRFICEKGLPSQKVWPRSKGWRTKPSDEAMEDAMQYRGLEWFDVQSTEEMVSCILQGIPVMWGANGHAVCKVRHLNRREGLDLNSWGKDWGDGGLGVWAPYSQVNWGYGAFGLRTAVSTGIEVPVPALL